MGFENMSQKQMERAAACKTPEELKAFAAEEGFELSDEELEGLAGGYYCRINATRPITCPKAVDTSGRPCQTYVFM